MGHLLYLMFRCDGDVMENLEFLWDLNTPQVSFERQGSFRFENLKFNPITSNIFKLFRRIKYKLFIKLSPESSDYFARCIY